MFRWRGTALLRIRLRLLAVFVLAVCLTFYDYFGGHPLVISITPFTLVGVTLGIFLGFRNNASYDRFWEGRKLWGLMVNWTRNYARQVLTLIGPPLQDAPPPSQEVVDLQHELVRRTIGYTHAVRQHLRNNIQLDELTEFLSAEDRQRLASEPNVPMALLYFMGERQCVAARKGWVHPVHHGLLEETLSRFSDIQGACERIKNTPVPFTYSVLIHSVVGVYCFTLPFALFEIMGFLTPLATVLVSYCFLGLDAVGDELEEPFGLDPNDLPLATLCTNIERDLKARIGLPLPERPRAVNEVFN